MIQREEGESSHFFEYRKEITERLAPHVGEERAVLAGNLYSKKLKYNTKYSDETEKFLSHCETFLR